MATSEKAAQESQNQKRAEAPRLSINGNPKDPNRLYANPHALALLGDSRTFQLVIDPPRKRMRFTSPGPYVMSHVNTAGTGQCAEVRFMEPGWYAPVAGEPDVYERVAPAKPRNRKKGN